MVKFAKNHAASARKISLGKINMCKIYDSIRITKAIHSFCENHENGLFIANPPTGFGKTYAAEQFICDFIAHSLPKFDKIFYITNNKANLPYKNIIERMGTEQYYDKILYIDNIESTIRKCIKENNEKITESLKKVDMEKAQKLYDQIKNYISLIDKIRGDKKTEENKELIDMMKNKFYTHQRELNNVIREKLRKLSSIEQDCSIEDKYHDILNSDFSWFVDFWPVEKIPYADVIFMSVSKFMMPYSCLLAKGNRFYKKSDMMKNAIIIVDEIDGSKSTMFNNIFGERKDDKRVDIRSFQISQNDRVINKTLGNDYYEYFDEKTVTEWYTLNNELKKFIDENHLKYDFRLNDSDSNELDSTFLVNVHNKIYINSNNTDIGSYRYYYQDGVNYINGKDLNVSKSIILIEMLCKLQKFHNKYQNIMSDVIYGEKAKNFPGSYADLCYALVRPSGNRNEAYNKVSENILKKTFHCIKLKDNFNNKDVQNLQDSFYENSLNLITFQTGNRTKYETDIWYEYFNDTPESILYSMCKNFVVIGLSATSTMTYFGNFNLQYLEKKLGSNFEIFSDNDEIGKSIKKLQYSDRIKARYCDPEKDLEDTNVKLLIKDIDKFKIELERAFMLLSNDKDDDKFQYNRLFSIAISYIEFRCSPCKASLFLSNSYYGKNETIINMLKNIENQCVNKELVKHGNFYPTYVNSENFKEKIEEFYTKASEPDTQAFLFASYATLGSGQNLQYLVAEDEEQTTQIFKDISGLYLEKPRNILIHPQDFITDTDKKIFALAQQFDLQAYNPEMYPYKSDEITRSILGKIGRYPDKDKYNIYGHPYVIAASLQRVVQGVGRICRTTNKDSQILIRFEKELANDIYKYSSFLNNIHLLPEIRAIKDASMLIKEQEPPKAAQSQSLFSFCNNSDTDNTMDDERAYLLYMYGKGMDKDKPMKGGLIYDMYRRKAEYLYVKEKIRKIYLTNEEYQNFIYTAEPNYMHNIYMKFYKKYTPSYRYAVLKELEMLWPYMQEPLQTRGWKISTYSQDGYVLVNESEDVIKGNLGEDIFEIVFNRFIQEHNIHRYGTKDYEPLELCDFLYEHNAGSHTIPVAIDVKFWTNSIGSFKDQAEKFAEKMLQVKISKALFVNIYSLNNVSGNEEVYREVISTKSGKFTIYQIENILNKDADDKITINTKAINSFLHMIQEME